jgi:hypothetical protein
MRMRMWQRLILAAGLAIVPAIAAAQDTAPPRLSVGAGAGVALPFHGDFDFTPWAWEGMARVALSAHVLIEGMVGEWRHAETFLATDVPSPPGTIGRVAQTTRRTQRSWQVNILATRALGRLRVSGGGGVGVLQHERRTQTTASDCSPGVTCGASESTASNAAGSLQGAGDVEARLAHGVAIFGQARLVVPTSDPAGADVRITAGLRWGR